MITGTDAAEGYVTVYADVSPSSRLQFSLKIAIALFYENLLFGNEYFQCCVFDVLFSFPPLCCLSFLSLSSILFALFCFLFPVLGIFLAPD